MPYKDEQKQKEYKKQHYLKNRDKYRKQSRQHKQRLYNKVLDYKRKTRCLYCGNDDPYCLDFHHSGDNKVDTVAEIVRCTSSWDKALQEIKKCDVVCGNCHRKLHRNEAKPHYANPYKQKNVEWFDEYKKTLTCELCGESEPCCLDFHHNENKDLVVGQCAGKGWSQKRILREIGKCKVLCANCHRQHHYKVRNGKASQLAMAPRSNRDEDKTLGDSTSPLSAEDVPVAEVRLA